MYTFQIQLHYSGSYFPGQQVQGLVYLELNKLKTITGIKLEFSGRCRVEFTKGGGRSKTYYTNDTTYFEYEMYLLGGPNSEDSNDITIQPGIRTFPFEFRIPEDIPPSFQGQHGSIQGKHTTTLPLTVNTICDLNCWSGDFDIRDGFEFEKEQKLCSPWQKSGPIYLQFKIDKTGFVPGQALGFIMEVDNQSSANLGSMRVKIRQMTRYIGESSCTCWNKWKHKETSESVLKLKGPKIQSGQRETWRGHGPLPSVPPTGLGGCELINVTYMIIVKFKLGLGIGCVQAKFPLVIGTIQLH